VGGAPSRSPGKCWEIVSSFCEYSDEFSPPPFFSFPKVTSSRVRIVALLIPVSHELFRPPPFRPCHEGGLLPAPTRNIELHRFTATQLLCRCLSKGKYSKEFSSAKRLNTSMPNPSLEETPVEPSVIVGTTAQVEDGRPPQWNTRNIDVPSARLHHMWRVEQETFGDLLLKCLCSTEQN